MRRYIILFLLLFVFGCTMRYIRISENQLISVDERTITYYMTPVSMPSINSPYIVVETKEIVRVLEVYEYQARVKKPLVVTLAPLIGVIPGVLLVSSGYVVLGRDIIGLSLLTQAAILGGIISLPEKDTSRVQNEEHFEERVPSGKEFVLYLEGEDSSNIYLPDNEGFLKINIIDFTPFYKNGENFEFKLISPKGDSLDLLIPTDGISDLFLKDELDSEY